MKHVDSHILHKSLGRQTAYLWMHTVLATFGIVQEVRLRVLFVCLGCVFVCLGFLFWFGFFEWFGCMEFCCCHTGLLACCLNSSHRVEGKAMKRNWGQNIHNYSCISGNLIFFYWHFSSLYYLSRFSSYLTDHSMQFLVWT